MKHQLSVTIKDVITNERHYLVVVASGENKDFITITKLHNNLCYVVNVNEGYTITTTYYPLERYYIEEISLYE